MSGERRALGDVQTPRSPHSTSPHTLHQIPDSEIASDHGDEGRVRLIIRGPTSDAAGETDILTNVSSKIGDVKDTLAAAGLGDRIGMRIVWSGKFLDDEQIVGQVFAARRDAYIVHLVARKATNPLNQTLQDGRGQSAVHGQPVTNAISPASSGAPAAFAPNTGAGMAAILQPAVEHTSPTTPGPSSRRRRTITQTGMTIAQQLATAEASVRASTDALHFFYFRIREHLSKLTGQPCLDWYQTDPKPAIPQADAQQCVDDLLKLWELEVPWDFDLSEEITASALSTEWFHATNLAPSQRDSNTLLIELDGLHYQLILPGFESLPQEVRRLLLVYCRLTRAAENMENILESSTRQMKSIAALATDPYTTNTNTTQATPPVLVRLQTAQRARAATSPYLTLLVSILPLSLFRLLPLVPSLTKTALKIAALIWMLTRDMAWTDQNFILIAVVGFAYLCFTAQGLVRMTMARYEELERVRAGTLPRLATAHQEPVAVRTPAEGAANNAPTAATAAQDPTVMELFNRRRTDTLLSRPIQDQVPRFHLPTDNSVLNLRHQPIVAPTGDPTSRDLLLATMFPAIGTRQSQGQRLSWLRTYLFIPLILWFVTLVPSWEVIRRREIRRREDEIRKSSDVLVKDAERDLEQIEKHRELADQGKLPREQVEAEERALREAGLNLETGHGLWSRPISLEGHDKKYAIPTNLTPQAERYWRRVLAKVQTVDWDEERDAQERLARGNDEQL